MTFRSHLLAVLLAGGIIMSGCSSVRHSKSTPAAQLHPTTNTVSKARPISSPAAHADEESELPAEQRAEAMARFATAVSQELNDKPDLALEEFYRAALADSKNQTLVTQTALRLLQANQNDKAIEMLRRTTQDAEAPAAVLALLSRAYFQAGQTNQAITASQAAIKRNPGQIVGYQTLADIYFQSSRFEDLKKVLDQAAKQPKTEVTFLINLAELYVKFIQSQPKSAEELKPQAIAIVNRAADLKTENPSLQQKLADTFNVLGERKKAAEIYVQLLGQYSEVPALRDSLREKLANVYLLSGDKDHAAEQLQAIIRDNPTRYPQAFYVLGTIAFDQKRYVDAADYFSKALVIVPDLEQAYYDLAAAQLNCNQVKESLTTLERASKKFPKSVTGEFYAGLACQKLKDYPAAIKHFTTAEIIAKATEVGRLDAVFYFQVGAAYERNGDYESAEKYFKKSLELKADDAETLNYLGYMWAERGVNLEKARELIEKALKLDPGNHAYLDSLGWVLYKLSQPEQALTFLLKAVESSAEADPVLYDHLGDVYSALKQSDKAKAAWQKSLSLDPNVEVRKKLDLSL